MKQLLLHKGKISIESVPSPAHAPHHVLVEVKKSLISTGTELASVQFSKDSLIEKARKKPDQVKKVIQSVKNRGILKTFALVQGKLDESKPLGYSCTGTVVRVGDNVKNFQAGDRVACAGAGLANHAEFVSVPKTLVTKVPAGVSDASAAFVTIGAIALQGVRRADLRLGEIVCVMGLGLIGQITVQLLKSSGCTVIGMDLNPRRVEHAKKAGLDAGCTSADELTSLVNTFTDGYGVDATLLTASTAASTPTRQAFELTRKKGKIVVVGALGMDLQRSPFYEKEQDFLISCSYGPGRYDPEYEQQGKDYPYAYVRWTENRNMKGFLDLIDQKKINVLPLVGKEFEFEESKQAYDLLASHSDEKPLAVLLNYKNGKTSSGSDSVITINQGFKIPEGAVRLGLIGAGNFVKTTHLPNIKNLKERVQITAVCTAQSSTAATMGRQLKSKTISTNYHEVISDPDVDAVIVATRHNLHAEIASKALAKGKHVFLEKPLALNNDELSKIEQTLSKMNVSPTLVVGFNRRYSPFAKEIKSQLTQRKNPMIINYRVNAGDLPQNHWAQSDEGGGRLRGEACHMIDFFQYCVGQPIQHMSITPLKASNSEFIRPDENFSAQFSYQDGSICNLIYTSIGNKKLPKEFVEVFWDGNSAVIEDFSKLTTFGKQDLKQTGQQDKGHMALLDHFIGNIENGISFSTPWKDLVETTQATIELDNEVWGRLSKTCVES